MKNENLKKLNFREKNLKLTPSSANPNTSFVNFIFNKLNLKIIAYKQTNTISNIKLNNIKLL